MRKIITRAIIILYIMASVLLAQNYGKIYGTITDAETNQALPDSRVIFTENDWNMATDTSGFYILMPLPMGTYSISITCPGYQNLTIEKIQVISNEGTRIDIALTPGQSDSTAIVIQAREQWATESIPYSYSRITADDIQRLPVRGLQNYLELQPGVVIQDEQVHIRGGRSDETGYFVNGLSTTNPLDNSNSIYIIPEAIEQIRVLPGIYSARYGGANSGIVLTDLKEGTADYKFTLNYQTDKFAKAGGQFLDTYSYRDQIVTATASGPVYFDNLRFFAAIENSGTGDAVKRFGEGFRIENLTTDDFWYWPPRVDTISIFYPDGYTPDNAHYRWAANSNIALDFKPFSARITVLFNSEQIYENDTPILDILNRRAQYMDSNKWLYSADFTHRISDQLYYTVGINRYINEAERYDDWFGNNWQAWDDSALVSNYTQGAVDYYRNYREPRPYYIQGFDFYAPGQTLEDYLKTSCTYSDIHGSVEWQASPGLNLQTGFFWRGYTLRRFAVEQDYFMGQVAKTGWDEEQLWEHTNNIYGYDIRGREMDTGINGPRKPIFSAGYLQSSWQSANTTIHAGIRLDYIFTDDRSLKTPLYPYVDQNQNYYREIRHDAWQKKEGKYTGSPRFSITTNMLDRTQIHLAYAKTVQAPALNQIYYDTHSINRHFSTYFFTLRPVGFDMNLIHSQHINLGFKYWFLPQSRFSLNAFYKKTRGQARAVAFIWQEPSSWLSEMQENELFMISNGDYAVIRGIEIGFSVLKFNGLSADFNYSYTSAQGTGSEGLSNYFSVYRQYNRSYRFDSTSVNISYNPLDFEIKHSFLFNLDYEVNEKTGGALLQNSAFNLVLRLQSGHPYTHIDTWRNAYAADWSADYERDRRNNIPQEPINHSTTPWTYQVDLAFEKMFSVYAEMRATFFVRILNVFNIKNVINVYTASNTADSDGLLTPQERSRYAWLGDQYYTMYETINSKNGQSYWMATGKQLYGHPRQILLGVRLAY